MGGLVFKDMFGGHKQDSENEVGQRPCSTLLGDRSLKALWLSPLPPPRTKGSAPLSSPSGLIHFS